MSRLTKEVKLTLEDGKTIIVTAKELTVKQIRNFWNSLGEASKGGFDGVGKRIMELLPMCVDGINMEDVEDMAPSDIKKIYDAFQEVNAVFFDLGKTIEGGNPALIDLRLSLMTDLAIRFAGLFRKATLAQQTMDSLSSSMPSE